MIIMDTESDGFKYESTRIWVIVGWDTIQKQFSMSFDEGYYPTPLDLSGVKVYDTHEEHVAAWREEVVCAHNYFQHDKPLLKRLIPAYKAWKEEDTYIQSQVLNPDRGGHGLEYFGKLLGRYKPEHEDWSQFSPQMVWRCWEDVQINILTYDLLQKEMEGWDWRKALTLEYQVADLQGRQEMYGLALDEGKAYDLAEWLYTEIQAIDETLLEQMPQRVIKGGVVETPYKLDGTLTKRVEDWFRG